MTKMMRKKKTFYLRSVVLKTASFDTGVAKWVSKEEAFVVIKVYTG